MSDLGLQFLEKSGDCFRFGQEWEKAVDVYSQIHNWKSVKEGMRVRTKIWEQECKFQSVMNDGTEMIKREGTKRSLPPHVLKQNIPESVEQAAETITEYSKFLSDLNESEWELMEVNNGFEHVPNLAYCAQLLLANIGQNEIDDFSQTVSELCLTAVLRTYPDVEDEQDELLSFYLNIRVSSGQRFRARFTESVV